MVANRVPEGLLLVTVVGRDLQCCGPAIRCGVVSGIVLKVNTAIVIDSVAAVGSVVGVVLNAVAVPDTAGLGMNAGIGGVGIVGVSAGVGVDVGVGVGDGVGAGAAAGVGFGAVNGGCLGVGVGDGARGQRVECGLQ